MFYRVIIFICYLTFKVFIEAFTSEVLIDQRPVNCNISEYFNTANLKCILCDQQKSLTPSFDKLKCVCNSTSRILKWHKSEFPVCEQCPEGEVPTFDRKQCIPCQNETMEAVDSQLNKTIHVCESCLPNEILVQRESDGSLLNFQTCIECAPGTRPSEDKTHCIICPFNNYYSGMIRCDCPSKSHESLKPDVCAPVSSMTNWPDEPSVYNIEYPLVNQIIESWFYKENLRPSVYLCKLLHQEACQAVANMCVMSMYGDDRLGGPCSLFRDSKRIPNTDKEVLPWLYYGEGDAPIVLSRRKITTTYSLERLSEDSSLNLTAKLWTSNGTWLGLEDISSSFLQLCPNSWNSQDAALRFASHYKIECFLQPKQIIQSRKTEFIELFLRYGTPAEPLLYAIPVLNKNLKQGARYPNKDSDMSQWQLTRRFFIIDVTSGISLSKHKKQYTKSAVVRYMHSCTLRVNVQESPEEGKIYPPLLIVEYGELTENDVATNLPVKIKFEVEYNMENRITYVMDVWIGVLCALVVIWTVLQTWNHAHRSGHLTIDIITMYNLCIIACGNLANVFFGVISAAAIHGLVCYKGQAVAQILLPPKAMDNYINTYIIVAFVLKSIELAHMVWWQIGVDIFLIDWERPRAAKTSSQPVSIWRTYFVANEWNEIQVKRKTSLLVQLLFTVFLIKICGLEHWTRGDPDINSTLTADMIYRPQNHTLCFALTVAIYISVYIMQWIFVTVFYERFIKNGIQEFVDICSLANISVFILAFENFGYYIHGRSAHGFADTDMQTIMNQLRREEEDLVGHRGLLPASDQQTFQMFIPSQLRLYYNKLVPSLTFSHKIPRAVTAAFHMKITKSGSNIDSDRSASAYNNMNKFLAAFLEHALKDLDYEVRDKLFVEALFDIEFSDSPGRGVLYVDNGHSFDKVLFYGNELTLVSFDLIVFCFVQMISSDILLAAIVTAFSAKFVSIIRKIGGRKNLSKKSLIEERFLI